MTKMTKEPKRYSTGKLLKTLLKPTPETTLSCNLFHDIIFNLFNLVVSVLIVRNVRIDYKHKTVQTKYPVHCLCSCYPLCTVTTTTAHAIPPQMIVRSMLYSQLRRSDCTLDRASYY